MKDVSLELDSWLTPTNFAQFSAMFLEEVAAETSSYHGLEARESLDDGFLQVPPLITSEFRTMGCLTPLFCMD